MMSTGQRNRLTIRAVVPETEQTTMALASTSMAMEQMAWDTASRVLRMWNS